MKISKLWVQKLQIWVSHAIFTPPYIWQNGKTWLPLPSEHATMACGIYREQ